jgi:prepilin peptidase CpaA
LDTPATALGHFPDARITLYGLLGVALAISLATDLRKQLIYNWVTFPTMGLALVVRFAFGRWGPVVGGWGLASGLVGFAVGFGFFLLPYLFGGGVKEGDVKLAGAVGAAVGFPTVIACLVFSALVGGLEAAVFLIWKGKFFRTVGKVFRLLGHKVGVVDERPTLEGDLIPYGVAIALGSVWGAAWQMRVEGAW